LVAGELGHHLALEHGDGLDGCLFGQSLGRSPGVNGLQHFGLSHLLRGRLHVFLLLLGHLLPGSPFLRFRRPSLRRYFLLTARNDCGSGSGGSGLDGGLGDLIYCRALNGSGMGGSSDDGGDVHFHG
jgi:hypothetical protein